MTKQPNILFIVSDQHNAKVLGHKGHPDVKTPNLDSLAARGMRFDNAITQNPICTPSRVSFTSGQYCHNHGYYGLSGPNPNGLPTVFGHFRKRGYRTAAIGKIHCPEYWVEDDTDTFYEVYDGCSVGGAPEYTAYLEGRGLLQDRDDVFLQEQAQKIGQSLDARASRLKYDDSPEGWIVRQVIDFMGKAADKGQPFLVEASLPRPHQVYAPSEPFWSMYGGSELTLPPNADYDLSLKAPHLRKQAESMKDGRWTIFEPRTFEAGRMRKLQGYLGCVSMVDHAVGQMLDWLRENGLEEDTIVIYTSDHGDYACEHGIMEKAPGICSDAITRVPLIWHWPGHTKTGHVSSEIVETIDITSTLCALANVEPMHTSDGKDISPMLRGESSPVREVGVTEFVWSKSLRKGQYRYVYYAPGMFPEEYPEGGFGELYDLEADPWEMQNRYFDPDYAQIVQELKGDLLTWLVSTTRPVTVLGTNIVVGQEVITRFKNSAYQDGKLSPEAFKSLRKNYL